MEMTEIVHSEFYTYGVAFAWLFGVLGPLLSGDARTKQQELMTRIAYLGIGTILFFDMVVAKKLKGNTQDMPYFYHYVPVRN